MSHKLKPLAEFFIDWSFTLVGSPFNGSILDSYNLFAKTADSSLFSSLQDYVEGILQINKLTGESIKLNQELSQEDSLSTEYVYFVKILSINKFSLLLLINLTDLRGEDLVVPIKDTEMRNDLQTLNSLLDYKPGKSTDIFACTTRESRLNELNQLLHVESLRLKLAREKLRMTTEITPFYNICDSQQHSSYCVSTVAMNGGDYEINEKMRQNLIANNGENNSVQEFIECLNTKIHFIPIIQQQTDVKLGDCSYLDTCHKISNCRYLHYYQLNPIKNVDAKIQEHNDSIEKNRMISDFTWGDPVGDLTRMLKQLPPQWVNCDIRKLDFDILGKFAAVIADPPWNIHMNLPYGTCNDSELLSLPIEKLQDEGILLLWVTGRSIEIGRESLVKWGYRIVDELIWIKTNQLMRTICTGRTGHWLNHSKEHLLFGIKGDPKWAHCGIDTDIIVSNTRETSRKPDEVYGIVERMVGRKARKLEIFGRDHNTRPGWMTIGNQLTGDNIIEKSVQSRYKKNKVV